LSAAIVVVALLTPARTIAAEADSGNSATIVIPQDARNVGYQTTQVSMAQGGTLNVVSFDDQYLHSVTSDDTDANGNPLFTVDVPPSASETIPAASALAPGSYGFHCRFHPSMRGTLTITGSGGGVQPSPQTFSLPLVRPKVLTSGSIKIAIKRAAVRVLPKGPLTTMWTYGGTYPGPTIVRPAGHDTKVTFVNDLTQGPSLSVHFHGDHHSYADDGQPTRYLIGRGASRTYDYPLKDGGAPERASFQWYHDHRMNNTTRDNWLGLQGMFFVTDGQSAKLGLPSGSYDVPLMVSERSFDSNNQLVAAPTHGSGMGKTGPHAPPNDGTVGDHVLVNGRFAPYLNVATHRYRLRLLNSSPFTTYDFALSTGEPFVQVGTGNGLLPKAVVRQDILLGPAQRADVVVDFRSDMNRDIVLESVPRQHPPANAAQSPSVQIMQFRVRTSVNDTSKLPPTLEAPPKMTIPSRVSVVWTAGLGGDSTHGTYWTINGKPFDPKRVDFKVPRGATQMWELRNSTKVTHYIHLHEEQWRTVSRDGKAPPAWERGLEDTWRLDPGETVRVVGHFTDYTGVFMIHCHMLDHEDDGLMAQFAVVDPRTKALPSGYRYQPTKVATPRAAAAASPNADAVELVSVPVGDDWFCRPPPPRAAPLTATL
jgi:FtsP/CotA-like multicopper oxidase with cupredoxin domain/plastocyanin